MKTLYCILSFFFLHSFSLLAQVDLSFETIEQEPYNYIPEIPYQQVFPNGDGYGYIAAGAQCKAVGSIRNTGTSNSIASTISFYLSIDNTLQTTDMQIGTISTTTISAGQYYFLFKTLTIPANTVPGSYRIIAKADNANAIIETNENNNIASFGITVLATADLVPTTVSAPTSISAGNPMSLICQVSNNGLATANATQVHYFLYNQNLLTIIELGYTAINPLAINTSNVKYPTFTVPVNTPPGTYQLYFVADGGGAIQELNEQNNASTRSITITAPRPDLTVFSATVPTATTAGSTLTGSTCQVKNIGSATANSSLLRIYLSNNNTYSSNDILLSSSTIGTTTPNGSYYRYPTLNIPNAISGNYYLLFQADANNQVTESNENNNITVRPITINPSSSRFANTGSITLTAYPNPTTDVLNLTWKATQNQKSLLTIYNANGQTVMQKDINTLQGSNTYTIDMLNLPTGVYVVIVDDMVVRVVKN